MDFSKHSSPGYTVSWQICANCSIAGVQAFKAYTAAAAYGLRIVGGECATVGLSGSFL
ncbi:hypothetical protein F5X99DRAFT_401898 [Biscogniauxia marginata]|nr:hypothetical protein F5X99DRAFT_401898 [Biscogniauxia marginata]